MELNVHFRSTANGFYTGTHWKCSLRDEPRWYTPYFDDSSWIDAETIDTHTFYSSSRFTSNYNSDAKIITRSLSWDHILLPSSGVSR